MQVKEQRVVDHEGDEDEETSPLKDVENWNENCELDKSKED